MEKTKYSRTKSNSNSISLPIQPYRGSWKENSNTRKIPAPMKGQDTKHLTTKSKAENHKHIKPHPKSNKTGTNIHLSLISLNINGHNSAIKRLKLTDWIHKKDPAFFCIQERQLKKQRQVLSQIKRMEKSLPSKWSQETTRSCHPNIQ